MPQMHLKASTTQTSKAALSDSSTARTSAEGKAAEETLVGVVKCKMTGFELFKWDQI